MSSETEFDGEVIVIPSDSSQVFTPTKLPGDSVIVVSSDASHGNLPKGGYYKFSKTLEKDLESGLLS